MKKTTMLMMLCCIALTANAEVIIDETFNYAEGTNLNAIPQWTTEGTLTTGAGRTIQGEALTYQNAGGIYINSASGKQVITDIEDATSYLQSRSFTEVNSGQVYLSLLFSPNGLAQSQTNAYVMAMADGNSLGAIAWVGKGTVNTSNFRFGITRSSTTSKDIQWSSEEYSDLDATYLVVIKYDFDASPVKASLFINPVIATPSEPSPSQKDETQTPETIRTKLSSVVFRATGKTRCRFGVSSIRVSTTWAEAVAAQSSEQLNFVSSVPASGDAVTSSTNKVVLTFNKAITKGSGVITLASAGCDNIAINLSECTINDKSVTVPVALSVCRNYTLSVPANAFMSNDNSSAALTVDFTTREENANLLLQDYFNYKAEQSLESIDPWFEAMTSKTGTPPTIGTNKLTYSGYGASGLGGSLKLNAELQGATTEAHVSTAPFASGELPIDQTIYTAFMVNLSNSSATASGRDFFSYLYNGGTSGTSRGRVFYKLEDEALSFGITKSASSPTEWSAIQPKENTALLVVKYVNKSKSSSGDADEFYLFVNPTVGKSEGENESVKLIPEDNSLSGGSNLQNVAFKCYNTVATIAGLRVATTWSDAVNYDPSTGIEQPTVGEEQSASVRIIGNQLLYIGKENAKITLCNAVGQTVDAFNVAPKATITLTNARGVYVVRTKTISGKTEVLKAIIR